MKRKLFMPVLALASLFLASCGGGSSSAPAPQSSEPASSAPSPSEKEIADAPEVASGDYIVSKQVYRIDKQAKKLKALDFGMSYTKYKANQGELLFETDIKFVQYSETIAAVKYTREETDHYIYKTNDSFVLLEQKGSYINRQTISAFPENFVLPTFGSYVSEKLNQYKVNEKGERIEDGQGSFVKEDFYLFLELSEKKADLYASDNAQSHGETPIHSVSDYEYLYSSAGITFKIPHKDGDFACTFTVQSDSQLHFVNSSEGKYGDYSGSGKLTLITK